MAISFLKTLQSIKRILVDKQNVSVNRFEKKPVQNETSVLKMCEDIGISLPKTVSDIFCKETGGFLFSWQADKKVFGPDCQRGFFHFLSPLEISEIYNDHLNLVKESLQNGLEEEEGYKDLINDWPYWVPVFRFSNGDCFCLDLREPGQNPPIAFLEHDVMDDGPDLHGLKIANDFNDLICTWSKLLFVDFYDWSQIVDEQGINLSSPVLQPLRLTISQ